MLGTVGTPFIRRLSKNRWTGNISFWLVAINWYPFPNTLLRHPASHEMIVDMIEAFGPCFETFLLEINTLATESAPEASLAVSSQSAVICFRLDDSFIFNMVVFLEMLLEGETTITDFGAGTFVGFEVGAAPDFEVEVLGVFVSFPVVLAAKYFVAG